MADDGHVAADPLGPPPAPAGDGTRLAARRGRRLAYWAAGVGVAVVIVVVAVLLADLGGSGGATGPTTADLAAGATATRTVRLHVGEAAGVEVRAEDEEVRFRVAIAVDGRAGRAISTGFASDSADPYDSGDYSEFFGSGRGDRRLLYAGRARGSFAEAFVAPASGTYTLAVRSETAARLRLDIETRSQPGLAPRYSPVELYRLRRSPGYRSFFEQWDRRSQGDVSAFTDFSDPYSDATSDRSDNGYSDYLSEYSDHLDDSGTSDNSS